MSTGRCTNDSSWKYLSGRGAGGGGHYLRDRTVNEIIQYEHRKDFRGLHRIYNLRICWDRVKAGV